jgi:hypothetical protein
VAEFTKQRELQRRRIIKESNEEHKAHWMDSLQVTMARELNMRNIRMAVQMLSSHSLAINTWLGAN